MTDEQPLIFRLMSWLYAGATLMPSATDMLLANFSNVEGSRFPRSGRSKDVINDPA